MTFWEAVLLGFIQGATEFLPVSSSGHLVIGQALLGLEIPGLFFEVAVHVATLVSVVIVYRRRVGALVSGAVRGDRDAWRYLGLLVLATVPAAVVGLLFRDAVEALFEDPWVAGVALLVTGGLLWSTRWAIRRGPEEPASVPPPPGVLAALLMGVGQAFALIPGISRSGTTVVVGLWAGVEAREAAAFSFLMAIPAITGAAVLQVPDLLGGDPGVGTAALLGGAVAAAITGVLAIWSFVAMLRRRAFHHFAFYCWLVGALFLVYLGVR